MQLVFETFITRLSGCKDEHDFCETMIKTARAFEIDRFAYISCTVDHSTVPRIISNYPSAWATYYREQAYHRIDPVVRFMQSESKPFLWPTEAVLAKTSEPGKSVLQKAAKFGIGRGMTIPIHDRFGQRAAVTFATDEADEQFTRTASSYQQALQLIATCFHINVRNRLSGSTRVDNVSLTKRELECLQWAARGKSARDTADILGIKRRTVSFHLDNVRRKFEVRTVAQAIAILAASRPDFL
jgi:DNA-binding CsgD family transcriptional regulator